MERVLPRRNKTSRRGGLPADYFYREFRGSITFSYLAFAVRRWRVSHFTCVWSKTSSSQCADVTQWVQLFRIVNHRSNCPLPCPRLRNGIGKKNKKKIKESTNALGRPRFWIGTLRHAIKGLNFTHCKSVTEGGEEIRAVFLLLGL